MAPRSLPPRAERLLVGLRDDLGARRFVPQRVRQKTIPKSSGKVRPLGIPTVADRVMQASLKLLSSSGSRISASAWTLLGDSRGRQDRQLSTTPGRRYPAWGSNDWEDQHR